MLNNIGIILYTSYIIRYTLPMLSISHAATGAFIAVKIGNPYLAIPLILLSHYLEDAVPHWDVGTGMTKGLKSPQAALRHEFFDLALAGILVLVFFPPSSYHLTSISYLLKEPQVWGSLLGLLPDFLEAPRNFWKSEPAWLRPLNQFHHGFHHSIPRVLDGLAPQFILLVVLWIFR